MKDAKHIPIAPGTGGAYDGQRAKRVCPGILSTIISRAHQCRWYDRHWTNRILQ